MPQLPNPHAATTEASAPRASAPQGEALALQRRVAPAHYSEKVTKTQHSQKIKQINKNFKNWHQILL